jgi:hypothetical protein
MSSSNYSGQKQMSNSASRQFDWKPWNLPGSVSSAWVQTMSG